MLTSLLFTTRKSNRPRLTLHPQLKPAQPAVTRFRESASCRAGNSRAQVIYTFNPPISKAHWINVEADRPNAHRFRFHTTYADWNAEWLGPFFFAKMDAIRAQSEERFQHEYLGIPVGTGNEIFTNVKPVRFTAEQRAEMRSVRYGMDFGQSDPTTLCCTNYVPHFVTDERGRREDIGGVLQVFDAWGKSDALERENAALAAELAAKTRRTRKG